MNKRSLLELIRKHNRGETTREEALFLENYYNLFGSEPGGLSSMTEENKTALKTDIYAGILEGMAADGPGTRRIRTPGKQFMMKLAVAASLLIVSATTLYLYYTPSTKKTAPMAASRKQENQLVYLPDGSTVIVSWGSKFSCGPSFGKDRRKVYLEGQAYFDIFHDPSRPFTVHTGKLETTVLGTAFNIKAIPGEADITITVTRGKVKISDEKKVLALVTPGRQMIYYKKADSAVQRPVAADVKLDWKQQDLLVNNVTVEEAAKLLEERFGVGITVSDSTLKGERFTTVFLKTEGLEQVLKSICEFHGAAYQYNREKATVIITKNAPSPN